VFEFCIVYVCFVIVPVSFMICVECGHPIAQVYREFSRGSIRLNHCVCIRHVCTCLSMPASFVYLPSRVHISVSSLVVYQHRSLL
jgi:Arv1-like family